MSNISVERWEDVIPDDEEGRERFMDWVHEFKPGRNTDENGVRRWTGKCVETQSRRDGVEYTCNGSSHDSMHLPIDGCCYCKHGVYLHTSYDIPCGRCEGE